MERMSEEEFINNIEGHITSLKNLDNKALKILVGKLEEENKKLKEEIEDLKKIRDGKDDYIRDLEEKNYELETEIVRLHQEAEYYGVKL